MIIEREVQKMFELETEWCEAHNFPHKIVNGCFYWQTAVQTGRLDCDGHCDWFSYSYFNEVE